MTTARTQALVRLITDLSLKISSVDIRFEARPGDGLEYAWAEVWLQDCLEKATASLYAGPGRLAYTVNIEKAITSSQPPIRTLTCKSKSIAKAKQRAEELSSSTVKSFDAIVDALAEVIGND